MSLRTKIIITISAMLAGLMVIVYATSRIILLDGFAKLESQQVRRDLQRGLVALSDDASELSGSAAELVTWDETRASAAQANGALLRARLNNDTLAAFRLNFVVLADASGRVYLSQAFDFRNKREATLPQGLLEQLSNPTASKVFANPSGEAGVLILGDGVGPVLVASQPLAGEGGQDAARGVLIVGRFLDDAEIAQLARQTRLSLTMLSFDQAASLVSNSTPQVVQPVDEQTIVGYALIQDVYAKPTLALKIDLPRDIYQQGQASLVYVNWSLFIVGLVFIAMTVVLWDRLALSRLAHLSAEVSSIGASGDLAARVMVSGQDELSRLAGSVNQMLEALQRRDRELAALNRASQAILSTLDLQAVLKLVISESRNLLGAEATSVLLYDRATDELVFAAADSPASERVLKLRMPAQVGIAGWVMQNRQAALVPDAYHDPRFYRRVDESIGMTTRSVLAVPLMVKDSMVGVIESLNKASGAFDQNDLKTLEAMASTAAIALENARLFEGERHTAERLQALSRRLVGAQEAERSRVARELHDEAGQALASLMVNLHLLEQEAQRPEKVTSLAAELKRTTDNVLENLHRLAVDLRPASLDHLGLEAALRQYIEAFSRQHNLSVEFEAVKLNNGRLPSEVETALYRVVQEALTNVARHAQATRADVILEGRGDRLILIVEDNGVGFDTNAAIPEGHLGLIGIKERAEMLNGKLVVESEVGQGTTMVVEVPYAHSNPRG